MATSIFDSGFLIFLRVDFWIGQFVSDRTRIGPEYVKFTCTICRMKSIKAVQNIYVYKYINYIYTWILFFQIHNIIMFYTFSIVVDVVPSVGVIL